MKRATRTSRMKEAAYTIGVDYGSNSVRAIVVDCRDGAELGSAVYNYPSGESGILLDSADHDLARQNPQDYLVGLESSVRDALAVAELACGEFERALVIGIGVDTTGSSPLPVDAHNRPLALDAQWQANLNAQCWLWKDHTSWREAAEITRVAAQMRPQYIAKCGNTYSSEWFWSKIWHCLKVDPQVFDAAYSWVELSDFIPAVLCGVDDPLQIRRNVCAAGHKALYAKDWGGLPDKAFLEALDPRLAALRDRLYATAYTAAEPAGFLCADWAQRLGLAQGIAVAMGEMDVHYGAIGSGVEPGTVVKAIGTSTCDCTVIASDQQVADIPGICGIVDGAILPGYYGIEAGQSAVGDIFNWFVSHVCEGDGQLHATLTEAAAQLAPGASGLLALDWNNGNRTVLVDPQLTGLLVGQTLHTTRAEIYRALIEATAFGSRKIFERLEAYGVQISRVVCCGGIAEKNPFLMQVYADITGCVMEVSRSAQSCALGAALGAAVAAGAEAGGYDNFAEAQAAMTGVKPVKYQPNPVAQATYDRLYALYSLLHDSFGGVQGTSAGDSLGSVMKTLLEIKAAARN